MKRRSKRHGFTLVEVVMTAAMLGVLAIAVPRVFRSLQNSIAETKKDITVYQNARNAQYLVVKLLRPAKISSVVIGAESGQPAYSEISYTNAETGKNYKLFQLGNNLFHGIQLLPTTEAPLIKNGLVRIAFLYPDPADARRLRFIITATDPSNKSTMVTIPQDVILEYP